MTITGTRSRSLRTVRGIALAHLTQQRHARFDPRLDRLAVGLYLQVEQHIAEATLVEAHSGVGQRLDMNVPVTERAQQIGDLCGGPE